jgi:nucleoside-diphosphate-sugar epimerase
VPFALAWFIGLFNEILAAMKGKTAGISRRTVKALCSSNSFSNQKARTLLGWEPKVDMAEGMQRTESWLRSEGYI